MKRAFFLTKSSLVLFLIVLTCEKKVEDDIIPPSDVRDLEVESTDFWRVKLKFTNVGDDGFEGKAQFYDIRFSDNEDFKNSPELFFDISERVKDNPPPGEPGTPYVFEVKDLKPKTRYFFAVKVYDDAGNSSRISNVTETVTLDVPGTSGKLFAELDAPYLYVTSDGKDVYLLSPSLAKTDGKQIYPIPSTLPPIDDAYVIWDGQKFVMVGGSILGEETKVPLTRFVAVWRDGKWKFLKFGQKKFIPYAVEIKEVFGPDGIFSQGLLNPKVVKLNENTFAIVSGKKIVSIETAKTQIVPLETQVIPVFQIEGDTVFFNAVFVKSVTTPESTEDPIVFPLSPSQFVVWGGRTQYNILSESMNLLSMSPEKFSWSFYLPTSGLPRKAERGCEAWTELESENFPFKVTKSFLLVMEDGSAKFYNFVVTDAGGILSEVTPEGFFPPVEFERCSAVYFNNKLYLLLDRKLYIIDYE